MRQAGPLSWEAKARGVARAGAWLCLAAALAGCGASPSASTAPGVNDPYEGMNRAVHGVNKGLDTVLVKPGASAYGTVIPGPVRQGIANVSDTLSLPGDIVNDLLQGNVQHAGSNTARLAVNVVFGLGGLFDVADDAGIPEAKTDFGETLHVWGAEEGVYLELPLFGPSTSRDAFGTVVDFAMNPLNGAFGGKAEMLPTVAKALSRLNDRDRYSNTVDSILYDSADSYAQARLLYLQNRRFELGRSGGGAGGATADGDAGFIDPYEDPYGE